MNKIYSILFTLLFVSATIVGQETDSKREMLNGHTFQSSSYFRTSFISTHLEANVGFGSTPALKIKGIFIDDEEILSFEGKVAFVDVAVTYQQRFTPWLAMYLKSNLAGRLGTDMSTIVADGVNTMTGFRIGWLMRVYHNKKLNLSVNVHVANVTGNFINVAQYIKDKINDVPNASVSKKVPILVVDVGFIGAYAFNPTYGIQFFSDLAYGESFERGRSQGYFSAGVLADMDFKPKFNVPIGLALGYVATNDPESISEDSGFSSIFIGKIGYSASKEFELGLQFSYFDVILRSVEGKSYVTKFMLTLKFFF